MSIDIEQLCCTYSSYHGQKIEALTNINLHFESGEFWGIMGHTGCGKSTLIDLIAGLLKPTSGRILLDGEDINSKSYDRRILRHKLGLVFQFPERQLFESTVEKDTAFGLKYSGLSKTDIRNRVLWALEIMGFKSETILEQSPMALSGGKKRRVAIAGVLAIQPQILMLDEPVAGLDPKSRESFLKLITELNHDGMTIIMVSHNADVLSQYASNIAILEAGKLIFQGSTQEAFMQMQSVKSLPDSMSSAQQMAAALRAKGMSLPEDIITYAALRDALISEMCEGRTL